MIKKKRIGWKELEELQEKERIYREWCIKYMKWFVYGAIFWSIFMLMFIIISGM